MPNSYPQVLQRIISSFLAAVFLCPFLGNKMRIIRIMFITRRMFHTFAEMGDAWDLSRIRSQCYNIYKEIFLIKAPLDGSILINITKHNFLSYEVYST